jgi:hypothetical protein
MIPPFGNAVWKHEVATRAALPSAEQSTRTPFSVLHEEAENSSALIASTVVVQGALPLAQRGPERKELAELAGGDGPQPHIPA